jgi:outer membrane scaffolding protein for murein synthesis (MipA/OmpV family)
MNSSLLTRSARAARAAAIRTAVVVAATLALRPGTASAQDQNDVQLEQIGAGRNATNGWDVTLGGGVAERPRYDGADSYTTRVVPLISASYDKGLFFAGPAGIGMTAINWQGLRVGPVLGFLNGRKQGDDDHLNGLGDIPVALTAGLFASYSLGPFSLRTDIRQAVTHQADGLYGDVSLNWMHPIIPGRLFVSTAVRMDFANGSYDRTYFGVSDEQSLQSGLPAYTPGGGIKDIGFNAGLDYRLSRHFVLRGFAGVSQLLGDDGSSPIVQSKTQGLAGFGLAYHF